MSIDILEGTGGKPWSKTSIDMHQLVNIDRWRRRKIPTLHGVHARCTITLVSADDRVDALSANAPGRAERDTNEGRPLKLQLTRRDAQPSATNEDDER